jgi:translation initiation factor IF-2
MSIRLNKVTKEFNIGLQTAVEFLQKKGFSEVEANPNYKITEEQYAQLQSEFSSDKGLRNEAKQLIQQHIDQARGRKDSPKPKAKPVEEVQIEAPKMAGPKILGRIDLDNKPAEAPKAEKAEQPKPKAKPAKEEKKSEAKAPAKEEPKAKAAPKEKAPAQQKKTAVAEQKEAPATPKDTPEAPVQQPEKPAETAAPESQPAPAEKKEEEVFRLTPTASIAPSLTIKGKIDLDSINQNTRPKKKTQEERRRERNEA